MRRLAIRAVRTTLLAWLGLAAACGTSESPYLAYRAEFDKSIADDAERHLREVASRWELVVYEQRRSAYDSTGVFVTFMFRDDRSCERGRATVLVGNHDFSTDDHPNRSVLGLDFYNNGDMPIDELDRLAFEIKHTMQDRFGLKFCRINSARSLCDEEYARLEEGREARLGAKGWR